MNEQGQKKKVFILVEGVGDIRVIGELITLKYDDIKLPPKDQKEVILENKRFKIILKSLENGWGYIKNEETINDIRQKTEEGYNCLIIVDADYSSKDVNGGIEKRKLLIEEIKKENNLSFDYFLLPNGQSDGDLEDLLVKAIPSERQNIFSCIKAYRDCLDKNLAEHQKKKKLTNKNILYDLYATVFNEKGKPSFDFNCQAFEELKKFLNN